MEIPNPFLLNIFSFFLVLYLPFFSLSMTTPTDKIFLDCGSSGATNFHGRSWTGDIGSKFISNEDQTRTTPTSKNPEQSGGLVDEVPYLTARVSRSEFSYSFPVTPGPKFTRLYFYPVSYPGGFDETKSFFSVKSGPFVLLNNFSASLNAGNSPTVVKEFCINVGNDQKLSLTFTPSNSSSDSFAFVNGIEVVSVPENLYYSAENDTGFPAIGETNPYRFENNSAFETIARLNVGGRETLPEYDTGMFRRWNVDDSFLFIPKVITLPFNTTINLTFSQIPNYSAPMEVYTTARTMGKHKEMNIRNNLTWEIPVDSGFRYFLRLHFCEFQSGITQAYDRLFYIYIADQLATDHADIYQWAGGSGIPIYRDYAVFMAKEEERNSKNRSLSIALQAAKDWQTRYNDAILNGIELFKLNDPDNNLAGPNPDPVPKPPLSPSQISKESKKFPIFVPIIVGVVIVVIASFLVGFMLRRSRLVKVNNTGSTTGKTSWWSPFYSYATKSTTTRDSRNSSLPSDLCHHYSLAAIKAATQNFDDLFIIGSGGFGNVYKGYIDGGSTPVAIKRLKSQSQQGAREFLNEIHMLSQLRHVHLVSLIGYCDEDHEMILVYDYMANGTLQDHLYKTHNPPLPWKQRLEICIHAARGLLYLHTGAKNVIIHRDVKTTNILLDETWVAKVSDFGLSRSGPTTLSKAHVSTTVKGTIGYLDPEYYKRQQLSEKSDVYSFGVVLLEVLCARPPINQTKDKAQVSLVQWAKYNHSNGTVDRIIDPSLEGQISPQCLEKYLETAFACVNNDGIRRPSMNDVCWSLEFALQQQTNAKDRIFQASPATSSNEAFTSTEEKSSSWSSQSQSLLSAGTVFSEITNPRER